MIQALQQPRRYRGFVLTRLGLQKLQSGIQRLETQTKVRQSARTIAERVQLNEADGIHPITVRKLLRCQQGVDKRSMGYVFTALQLTLETGDYAHASLSSADPIVEQTQVVHLPINLDESSLLRKANFYGRVEVSAQLKQKVLERCRLVTVFGVEGIGKTALVQQLVANIEDEFDRYVWISLHPATAIDETLTTILHSLSGQSTPHPTTVELLISRLLKTLKQHRCLLVLDGVETILENRPMAGYYRPQYEAYSELFRAIAEHPHNSCLILTSQEKPKDFNRLEGQFVCSMQVEGLTPLEGQQFLQSQKVFSRSPTDLSDVSAYYAGNPLFLKWIAARVWEYFNGNLSDYLKHRSPPWETVSQTDESLLFRDLQDLLTQQFDRLSHLEQKVVAQLADRDDWVSLSILQPDFVRQTHQQDLLDVLDSLHRRSLLQKRSADFKLSPTMAAFVRRYKIEAFQTKSLPHDQHSVSVLV